MFASRRTQRRIALAVLIAATVLHISLAGARWDDDRTPPRAAYAALGAPVADDPSPAPSLTPIPTATPTASPTAVPPTPIPPTPVPPPAGNRADIPVDEQAREKAVLFALEAAGVPAALWSEFLTVGWCEGRWNPTAYNPGVQVGAVWVGPFYGVWQAEKLWWDLAGEVISEDVNAQARVMWATYLYNLQRNGYGWAAHQCQP